MRITASPPAIVGLCAIISTAASPAIDFAEHAIDTDIHGVGGIHTGDLDRDGDVDVLAAGLEDSRIVYWANSGTDPIEWTRHTI